MEGRIRDSSDSDNEIQFIEPLNMSGSLKPRGLSNKPDSSLVNYENIGERIAGFLSASITVCLMIGLHATHLFFVFLPWMDSRTKEGYSSTDFVGVALWIILGLMSLFVFMGFWSFTVALTTDNRVAQNAKFEVKSKSSVENFDDSIDKVEADDKKQQMEYKVKRWCKKCDQEKPMRAHHCSVCNACVLRMDHHCPWINNCVGYRNHGHYLRFLFYVILAMISGLVLMASRLATYKGRYMYWGQRNGRFSIHLTDEMMQMAFLVADLVGCGILSLLIGLLLVVQLLNVSRGHTTIESLEISQCERDIRRQRRLDSINESSFEVFEDVEIPFPYDLGFDNNLEAVFGVNRWLWPFPLPISMNSLQGSSPTGRSFKIRSDALLNGQWPLPSKDPLLLASRGGSPNDGAGYVVNNVNYGNQIQEEVQNNKNS